MRRTDVSVPCKFEQGRKTAAFLSAASDIVSLLTLYVIYKAKNITFFVIIFSLLSDWLEICLTMSFTFAEQRTPTKLIFQPI